MKLRKTLRKLYTYALPTEYRIKLEKALLRPYPDVFDKRRFIFIHIPKTGGKSIGNLIGTNIANHLKLSDYEAILGKEKIQKYSVFTIVRNPEERFLSAWRYILNGGNGSKEDAQLKNYVTSLSASASNFAIHHLHTQEFAQQLFFRPQNVFLRWSDGMFYDEIIVCKLESLDHDISSLPISELKNRKIPHLNRTTRNNESISTEAMEAIREFYKNDYDAFNY